MLSQNQYMHPKVLNYVKDSAGVYVYVSPNVLESLSINANDILGYSDFELPDQKDNAPAWVEADKRIMSTETSQYLINAISVGGVIKWQYTHKAPLYGRNGKIQGVSGAAIFISESSLIPITKQQTACLKYLAMGLTHKQIARELGLSQKTVEHYLDAVKTKLNCSSRADLIMQAIERGLVGVF